MLPSETMIWQPEFTDKTLSRKTGAVHRHDTGTLRGACRFWGINRFRHQTGEGDRVGKGGGKAHTPVEAKDNLKSTQMMSVIDAIGEGPVEGPVKGLQSILVNKTPLTDTDGNPVIHGVTAVWRAGEQEQTPPEGFE
ncbi:hypothetical protein, partial [Escherichia coli]|uniref:hypothetical protein n=1 Tax=Escherichia coli TaxID=562 RepID=UPI00202350D0